MPNPPTPEEQAILSLALVAMNIKNGDRIPDDADRIVEVIELLKKHVVTTEADAFRVLWDLASRFDWAGCTPTTFTDVEDILGRELTPDEREKVSLSWEWRKGIIEVQAVRANEMVDHMLMTLGIESADEMEDANG